MIYSIILHGAIFGVAWLSTFHSPPVFEFTAFEIELVSPPAAVQAEERTPAQERVVVERPRPQPEPERPRPEPTPEQRPPDPTPRQPEPERPRPPPERPPEPRREQPQPPAPTPPEPSTQRTPAAAPEPPPDRPPATSGENINVRLEGLRRDYPEYYNNIIRQIDRCFRWQGAGGLETQVSFVIGRDGMVGRIEFVRRSGNTSFDFAAMGAVECAGQGRFGPLPEDLPYESLPVLFEFRPSGR